MVRQKVARTEYQYLTKIECDYLRIFPEHSLSMRFKRCGIGFLFIR